MLAVQFHAVGDPSVLQLLAVPEPRAPRGDELLVRVEASSVNGTDLGLRRGDVKAATWGRLPITVGFDLCGEVIGAGPAVTSFAVGDRVMALLSHQGGGQAQQVLLRQGRAALAPRTASPVEAAALPLAGLTALQALHARAALHTLPRGSRVLVNGASGGIGSFGVQLAVLAGAHVTGVASGAKLDFVTGLGAHDVLDYRAQDLAAVGERWDVVLDAAAKLPWRTARRLLSPTGVLVSTRVISRDAVHVLRPPGRGGARWTAVATKARSADLTRLATLVDEGRLRPSVDRVFAPAEAAEAHRHAEGAVRGKVVLDFGRLH